MEPMTARRIIMAAVRQEQIGIALDEGRLPLVVIILSIILVAVSFLRRRLEADFTSKAKPVRNASSFAVILKAINGYAVVEDLFAQRCNSSNIKQSCSNSELPSTISIAFVPDDLQSLEKTVNAASGEVTNSDRGDCCLKAAACDNISWGCKSTRTYSVALLLAHREIHLKTLQGPPGLDPPLPDQDRRVFVCAARKALEPVQLVADQEQQDHVDRQEDSRERACMLLSLQELHAMKPPRSKCRLVVALSGKHAFSIYVNVSQNRYQIYRGKEEIRSVAWGGNSLTKMNSAWHEALRTVAHAAQ